LKHDKKTCMEMDAPIFLILCFFICFNSLYGCSSDSSEDIKKIHAKNLKRSDFSVTATRNLDQNELIDEINHIYDFYDDIPSTDDGNDVFSCIIDGNRSVFKKDTALTFEIDLNVVDINDCLDYGDLEVLDSSFSSNYSQAVFTDDQGNPVDVSGKGLSEMMGFNVQQYLYKHYEYTKVRLSNGIVVTFQYYVLMSSSDSPDKPCQFVDGAPSGSSIVKVLKVSSNEPSLNYIDKTVLTTSENLQSIDGTYYVDGTINFNINGWAGTMTYDHLPENKPTYSAHFNGDTVYAALGANGPCINSDCPEYKYQGKTIADNLVNVVTSDTSIPGKPVIASDGENYLVLFHKETSPSGLYGVIVSKDFHVGTPFYVSPAKSGVCDAVFDGTDYFVVYSDYTNYIEHYGALYGLKITRNGVLLNNQGDGFLISEGVTAYPSVDFNQDRYTVAWCGSDEKIGNSDFSGVFCAQISMDGSVGPKHLVYNKIDGQVLYPSIHSDGENYLVVWEKQPPYTYTDSPDYNIYGRLLNSRGEPVTPDTIPIATGIGAQELVDVVFDGSSYFVLWNDVQQQDCFLPFRSRIMGRRVSKNGQLVDGGSDTNGVVVNSLNVRNKYLSLTLQDGHYIILWVDTEEESLGTLLKGVKLNMDQSVTNDAGHGDIIKYSSGYSDLVYPVSLFNGNTGFIVWANSGRVEGAMINAGDIHEVVPVENQKPLANAGLDHYTALGSDIELDGSRSSDPEMTPLTYTWTMVSKPLNSLAVLSDPNSAIPSFRGDVKGDYVFQLAVNDGELNSDSDQVKVFVGLNLIPLKTSVKKMVYDGKSGTVLALDAIEKKIMVIDPDLKQIVNTIDLSVYPSDACFGPGHHIYVISDGQPVSIVEYDLSTMREVRTISTEIATYGYNSDDSPRHFHIYYYPGKLFVVDSKWAPTLWTIDLNDTSIQISYPNDPEGLGDLVFSDNYDNFYYWYQYGWTAGFAGSYVYNIGYDGTNFVKLDENASSYPTILDRDPLDTPIFFDETSGLVIVKRYIFDADHLQTVIHEFDEGEDIYAVDFVNRLASSKNKIYNLDDYTINSSVHADHAEHMFFDESGTLYYFNPEIFAIFYQNCL